MNSDTTYRKSERKGMRFHGRKQSGNGVAGFVISVVCVVAFLILCVISAAAKGESGMLLGVFGILVMAGCGVSLRFCLKALKERDVYVKLPFAGMIISGVMLVLLFCLYVTGIRF